MATAAPALDGGPIASLATAQAVVQQLQAALAARQATFRAPPPVPDSCCGRGCQGCVWEGFYAAMTHWRDEAQARLAAAA